MATSVPAAEAVRTKRLIKPTRGWAAPNLGEVWEYRELLYFLTWRDIKVRYKQAVLGIAWAVLQPVLTMVVFTIVFQRLMQIKYEPAVVNGQEIPYPIFVYAALLPWQLFAGSLSRSGISLVGSASLITKIYFPRLVIPISAVIAGLVDFVIAFAVFLVLMVGYGLPFSWHIVALPLLVLLAMVTALACGLWLSALNVLYRDVQYIIPFLVQLWMFLSAVFWQIPENPEGWEKILLALNPMIGVIQGFRWALYGGDPPNLLLVASAIIVTLLLVTGLMYFKRMERTFADVV